LIRGLKKKGRTIEKIRYVFCIKVKKGSGSGLEYIFYIKLENNFLTFTPKKLVQQCNGCHTNQKMQQVYSVSGLIIVFYADLYPYPLFDTQKINCIIK